MVLGYLCVVVATCCVALRFISRGYILRVLGPTDWVIFFSLILSVLYLAVTIIMIQSGYGIHTWDLSPEQLKTFYRMTYASTLIYSLAVIATKVSILLLFLNVFSSTLLRKATYVVFAGVAVHGSWILFSNIFFCVPVQAFWDFELPRDRCFSYLKWFIEMWLHIALDFVITLLPIPIIRSMTLPWRQKFWLYFVFVLGFAVCIVASVRLYFMYRAVTSTDPTYEGMMVIVLAFVELNLAIAIPCILTFKPLVDRSFPGLLARKQSSNRVNYDGSPVMAGDSVHPPTISSPLPRRVVDEEMREVC
ncbi:hypothetical protein OQA88_8136 [Cercophora sp. LCS_1]